LSASYEACFGADVRRATGPPTLCPEPSLLDVIQRHRQQVELLCQYLL
jgi:hypothetical protein